MCKVNIGKKENSNFAQISNYWNDETVENIAKLLHKYRAPFPKG
jgi:hypothetical protein